MLEDQNREIVEERSTSKTPLEDDDVRQLLARARRVLIARGQNVDERSPEDIDLDEMKGRSGKYRAPIILDGDTLVVGFNQALSETL